MLTYAGKIFRLLRGLSNDVRLVIYLLWDKRVSFILKLPVIAAILYFISPIDLFSDFYIPGFGYIDDVVLLILAVRFFLNRVPIEIKNEWIRGTHES